MKAQAVGHKLNERPMDHNPWLMMTPAGCRHDDGHFNFGSIIAY